MSNKYRSDAMASIRETMKALHNIGAIDKQTMRRFDEACLGGDQSLEISQHTVARTGNGS